MSENNELNPIIRTKMTPNAAAPGPVWSAIVVLAVAVIGGAWYVHHSINKVSPPAMQSSALQATVNGLQARLDAQQANLKDWSRQSGAMQTQVDKLEHGHTARVSLSKHQTNKMMNQIEDKVDATMSNLSKQEASTLEARLSQVETTQRTQVARLEHEVAGARRQLADLRTGSTHNVTMLSQKEQQDARQIAAMEKTAADTRVNFTATHDHGQDLEPGISLMVLSADPGFQKYSGYVFLEQDSSTVFFKNQDAQVPLMIYPKSGGQPLQLVAQHVGKHDVTGYLLVPPAEMSYVKGVAFASAMPGAKQMKSQ